MAKPTIKLFAALLSVLAILGAFSGHFSSSEPPALPCFSDSVTSPASHNIPKAFNSALCSGDGAAEREMYSPLGLLDTVSLDRQSRSKLSDTKVWVGGMPFGVKFMTEGLLVVGFCDVTSGGKEKNPCREAGILVGDRIIAADGKKLSSSDELTSIAHSSSGKTITLTCERNGAQFSVGVRPTLSDAENKYKTGIFVRDSGAGIGTVTYILPETGEFGGLGHAICDSDTGRPIPMERGSVVGVTISGVKRGEEGAPGEVKGYFSSGKTGTLLQNTECGVFGFFADENYKNASYLLPLADRREVRTGKATIRTTLDNGSPQDYEIEITDIDRSSTGNKCFTIKVTDERLVAKTGGIIQGMSGSPIIQNGKLVGAVTHVLVNDPASGYGIFIDNMLNSAQMPMAKAS